MIYQENILQPELLLPQLFYFLAYTYIYLGQAIKKNANLRD
jgi:hypothetical protein